MKDGLSAAAHVKNSVDVLKPRLLMYSCDSSKDKKLDFRPQDLTDEKDLVCPDRKMKPLRRFDHEEYEEEG